VSSILELCQALPVFEVVPGAVLLVEGETFGTCYVLIDGAVEIIKGDIQVHIVSDPGAIFGEMAALLNIPDIATVRAITPGRVHRIEGGAEFLLRHPEIANSLLKLFAQRLYGLTNYLGDIKRQFEHHDSHLAMVHEVLETLVHHPQHSFTPGSDRDSEVLA
jgi:CRP/FNR family transcriptional regulator, cyclic AMP receptor protein